MYSYAQDIQNTYNGKGVVLPVITDKDSLDYFKSENNTSKLTETHPISIAETRMEENLMETIPMTITQHDIPNKFNNTLWGIPIFYIHLLEDR